MLMLSASGFLNTVLVGSRFLVVKQNVGTRLSVLTGFSMGSEIYLRNSYNTFTINCSKLERYHSVNYGVTGSLSGPNVNYSLRLTIDLKMVHISLITHVRYKGS